MSVGVSGRSSSHHLVNRLEQDDSFHDILEPERALFIASLRSRDHE